MKALSTMACAFCAVLGLTVSATAETETIAYWPFGTNGFHDVSGNGRDLVGVEIAESDAAYMVLNQGTTTGQYLKTATALDLSGETAVTFECWWRKTAAYNGSYPMLMAAAHVGANDLGSFFVSQYSGADGIIRSQYRSAAESWQLDYTNNNDPMFVGGKVNDGMWHHVAYVVNRAETTKSKQCRLYVDGVEVAKTGVWKTEPNTIAALFNDYFVIGGGTDYNASDSWNGYIDDVRISRGVLTPDEFLKYPTVGKTMRADDGKLPVVAYWPFGGKSGKDVTDNGFDLTFDATLPMRSGAPYPQYNTRTAWTNFYLTSFPFSAFSKTGVTIECFAWSGSAPNGGSTGNIAVESSQWWNSQGAFRFSYESTNTVSVAPSFKRVGVHFYTGSGFASSVTTEAEFGVMNDSKWRHFAIVYDPSRVGPGIVTLYVDGVAATDDEGTAATQGAFALRDDVVKFAQSFFGSFDDLRITAGVLTPDQFLASRSVGSTVALYRFDQSSLADVSGNGTELDYCQGANVGSGTPTFGDGGYPESGTGLVFSGKNADKDWIQTANPIDLTNTKGLTVEFDFNGPAPKAEDDSTVYVMAASSNATLEKGGFVVYRTGDALQGQIRKNSSSWISAFNRTLGSAVNGYHHGRYTIDANTPGKVTTYAWANGASTGETKNEAFDSLGNLTLSFGHCSSYYGYASTEPCYLKGKILRVAISDVVLDSADFVLENLPPDPETKATLAYWDFNGFDDKSGSGNDLTVSSGCKIRRGALALDGASSAVTDDTLYLSGLTQATIECFVCFGGSASSGTLFSMGSGAGSFTVTADATAGTLSGSFIPYDHLAASNGGTAAPDPFEGRKVWHHVALVIDRTKSGADAVRFYVDYQRATPAGRAWDNAASMLDGTLVVGADSAQTGSFFTGFIDDLRVSKGALEPS
ncbi:MAG: laminin G domain-containing protein [Kiritimatiellae bacterium]|nr:laminin G domain-containing protein [Kiritimatiellia bacterium]